MAPYTKNRFHQAVIDDLSRPFGTISKVITYAFQESNEEKGIYILGPAVRRKLFFRNQVNHWFRHKGGTSYDLEK